MADKSTIIAVTQLIKEAGTKSVPDFSPEFYSLWTNLLQDIPNEIVMVAGKQLAVESIFFPALSELRNKSLSLMKPSIPTWGEAWEECHNYNNDCYWNGKKEFSHPLVEQAYKQIGNWDTILTEDIPTIRAQFRQMYESLVYRAENDLKLLPESKAISEKYQLGVGELVKKLSA